jgi:hypothetical protein
MEEMQLVKAKKRVFLWINKIAIFVPLPCFVLRPLSAGDDL